MLKLTDRKWQGFTLKNVFKISSGVRLTKEDMSSGKRPFIGSTDSNNGVTAWVDNVNASFDKNVLGINYNGSVCEAFYHPYECVFSDDVKRLHLLCGEDSKYTLLFIKTCILKQKIVYSYGYKFNAKRMSNQRINLPINDIGEPDWGFMEAYMRQVEQEILGPAIEKMKERITQTPKPGGGVGRWNAFILNKVFEIKSTSSSIDKKNLENTVGYYPYITRSDNNNGIDEFVGEQPKYRTDEGNVITIGLDTQTVFYQPTAFYTGQNIHVLRHPKLNRLTASFLNVTIKKQLEKFNWGSYGATLTRLKRSKILLPSTEDGEPDWQYMEEYMKYIEQRKLRQVVEAMSARVL